VFVGSNPFKKFRADSLKLLINEENPRATETKAQKWPQKFEQKTQLERLTPVF